MRIIRGRLKNKKLNFPINLKTRPLKDRVRENIFNILEHSTSFGTRYKRLFCFRFVCWNRIFWYRECFTWS